MKIYIASDHGGVKLKKEMLEYIEKKIKANSDLNLEVEDLGTNSEERTDYPIYAEKVSKKVMQDLENNRGILICKSGHGMAYSANKFKGIRASLVYSEKSIEDGIKDDGLNVICISSNDTKIEDGKTYIDRLIDTKLKVADERYTKRIEMVNEIEKENMK